MRREQTTRTHRFLTSPQNAQRKPLVKLILDKLGNVFETATALKAAFYSPLNSKSPNFSEAKAFKSSLRSVYYTEEYGAPFVNLLFRPHLCHFSLI